MPVNTSVDVVVVKAIDWPIAGSKPLGRSRSSLKEAGIIAFATLGLVLVPSVQSLGLSVDPVLASAAGAPTTSRMKAMSDAIVSNEVAALVTDD